MTRQHYIDNIDGQYPIDSEYSKTNEIGLQLLGEAMKETGFDWRLLPIEVLEAYSRKCDQKANATFAEFANIIAEKRT